MLRVYRGYVAITWLQSASKGRVEDRRRIGGSGPAVGEKNYSRWRLGAVTRLKHRDPGAREDERQRAEGSARRDYYRACHRILRQAVT